VLGASKTVHVENKMLFILTGNNLCFAGDMPRRVLTCGIDPKMANPVARSFEIEPLNYVLTHREKMVTASLTIIRGWFSSIEYKNKKKASGRMASFENWDDLVRQPIAWISEHVLPEQYDDVMDAIIEAQNNDPEQEILLDLIKALKRLFGGELFMAKDVVDKMTYNSEILEAIEAISSTYRSNTKPNTKQVGWILKNRKGKIIDGLSIIYVKNIKKVKSYRIEDTNDNLEVLSNKRNLFGFSPVPPKAPPPPPPPVLKPVPPQSG